MSCEEKGSQNNQTFINDVVQLSIEGGVTTRTEFGGVGLKSASAGPNSLVEPDRPNCVITNFGFPC